MNEYDQKLQGLMNKKPLSARDVKDGVVACFFTVNREFVKRRMGEIPAEQVDAALQELVTTVFDEHQVDPENPSLPFLKKAELVLEEQADFETEPDLLKMHKSVVADLFSRAEK